MVFYKNSHATRACSSATANLPKQTELQKNQHACKWRFQHLYTRRTKCFSSFLFEPGRKLFWPQFGSWSVDCSLAKSILFEVVFRSPILGWYPPVRHSVSLLKFNWLHEHRDTNSYHRKSCNCCVSPPFFGVRKKSTSRWPYPTLWHVQTGGTTHSL